MPLNLEDGLRAYARMLNTGKVEHLEPLLADDFHYSSQNVLDEMTSKADFIAYITQKLITIEKSGAKVFAEMGYVHEPCVVIAQYEPDNLVSVVLGKVEGDKLTRLDMCIIPSPEQATRSGDYPA